MEQDVWQYYQANAPGQVQLLGVDMWSGTPTGVGSFRTQTGATYPLLLCGVNCVGATGTCGTSGSNCANLSASYGPFDNYIVINKQGIVRYHAANLWPHGNRYHLDEIRGCVDSLTSTPVGVDPALAPRDLGLRVAPNPFRGSVAIELANPGGRDVRARVTVHDLTGRTVATLLEGVAVPGTTRLTWDARGRDGRSTAPGLYFVRAEIGSARFERRVVYVR